MRHTAKSNNHINQSPTRASSYIFFTHFLQGIYDILTLIDSALPFPSMNRALVSSAILRTGISVLLRNAIVTGVFNSRTCSDSVQKSAEMEELSNNSIHGASIKDVHEVPFNVIIRPLPSQLEEEKVISLMGTLQDPAKRNIVPPIDVLWVKGSEGGDYYYSFGGCHRYEAHKRLGLPTIRSKLIKSTIDDIRIYLGSSMPDLK